MKSGAGFFFACLRRKAVLMDGEQDGAQETGQEQQGQQVGQAQPDDKQGEELKAASDAERVEK